MRFTLPLIAAAALLSPVAAMAHPKIVSATPAADATVAAPTKVEIKFSEKLMPKLSAGSLMMTGMGGKAHAPMAVSGVTSTAAGNTLVLTSAKPLMAGSYMVDWHIVSADTHRVAGNYAFTVK